MQFTQKHSISISIIAVLAILAYLIFQHLTTPQSDEVKTSTGANNSTTGSVIQTGSDSDTKWGLSPFASGSSGSSYSGSTDSGSTVFQMPNTEWKSRSVTLSDGRTFYYEFGKGNPTGVAMNVDQIKEINKICADVTNPEAQKLIDAQVCNQESGLMAYVTPEVEKYLFAALSDANWSKLATVCEKNFRAIENADSLINAQNDTEYRVNRKNSVLLLVP